MELFNDKPLIFHTINEALKVNEFKKIIITTSDDNLIKRIKKNIKVKSIFIEEERLSSINMDYKNAIIEAINKQKDYSI